VLKPEININILLNKPPNFKYFWTSLFFIFIKVIQHGLHKIYVLAKKKIPFLYYLYILLFWWFDVSYFRKINTLVMSNIFISNKNNVINWCADHFHTYSYLLLLLLLLKFYTNYTCFMFCIHDWELLDEFVFSSKLFFKLIDFSKLKKKNHILKYENISYEKFN